MDAIRILIAAELAYTLGRAATSQEIEKAIREMDAL